MSQLQVFGRVSTAEGAGFLDIIRGIGRFATTGVEAISGAARAFFPTAATQAGQAAAAAGRLGVPSVTRAIVPGAGASLTSGARGVTLGGRALQAARQAIVPSIIAGTAGAGTALALDGVDGVAPTQAMVDAALMQAGLPAGTATARRRRKPDFIIGPDGTVFRRRKRRRGPGVTKTDIRGARRVGDFLKEFGLKSKVPTKRKRRSKR